MKTREGDREMSFKCDNCQRKVGATIRPSIQPKGWKKDEYGLDLKGQRTGERYLCPLCSGEYSRIQVRRFFITDEKSLEKLSLFFKENDKGKIEKLEKKG